MQGLTQKTEGGQSPGSDRCTAGSPDSPPALSDMWGFGAGGEMSTALLHESIKHVFLLYMCSLSCLGTLMSFTLCRGPNLLKLIIREEAGSVGNITWQLEPGVSRNSLALFPILVIKTGRGGLPSCREEGHFSKCGLGAKHCCGHYFILFTFSLKSLQAVIITPILQMRKLRLVKTQIQSSACTANDTSTHSHT